MTCSRLLGTGRVIFGRMDRVVGLLGYKIPAKNSGSHYVKSEHQQTEFDARYIGIGALLDDIVVAK